MSIDYLKQETQRDLPPIVSCVWANSFIMKNQRWDVIGPRKNCLREPCFFKRQMWKSKKSQRNAMLGPEGISREQFYFAKMNLCFIFYLREKIDQNILCIIWRKKNPQIILMSASQISSPIIWELLLKYIKTNVIS